MDILCRPKEKGGLGINFLERMNISLLCKWWCKLESEEGLWQDLVQAKYVHNRPIALVVHKQFDSACWADFLKVKHLYLENRSMRVGNGEQTSVWEDAWCTSSPFKFLYPNLFEICNEKELSVAEAFRINWQLTFRRWLPGDLQTQLRMLKDKVLTCPLGEGRDKPVWLLTKYGEFTVKSLYSNLNGHFRNRNFKNL